MVDIFKNNLKEFDINNNTNNTIICNASEIENSDILSSLSPTQKSSIHLNVKIFSDKDIENFIYLEQNGNYKSINIILTADFNLSKTACEKLSSLVTINSVLKCNTDGKFKGCSFKNYSLMTAVICNMDTTVLLNSETLYFLKNFTKREDNYITILNINYLSKEIFHYFREKQYNNIHIQVTPNITFTYDIELLYIIFERISDYTNSININIENTIKFNIIYTKVIEDIKEDNEKSNKEVYNNLSFCGYHFILYQTLINLNIKANLVFSELTNSKINNKIER